MEGVNISGGVIQENLRLRESFALSIKGRNKLDIREWASFSISIYDTDGLKVSGAVVSQHLHTEARDEEALISLLTHKKENSELSLTSSLPSQQP